ncbi:hypothetical protein E1264_03335 [Actinomadura sp. KC216]|uniref:hypothetical protein n=1 Tax=Actinomadura sp. KC216 TaxID=2530370 RepID=UPI00104AB627|nr:hypothetical protein [Actinomadura sp. KC216]TDB90872.1 hypothetical protein E1264_03335 [Actinomadura sp. KC216]
MDLAFSPGYFPNDFGGTDILTGNGEFCGRTGRTKFDTWAAAIPDGAGSIAILGANFETDNDAQVCIFRALAKRGY